jgi:DNA-binding transcriptional regulator GbsR (MarR family)
LKRRGFWLVTAAGGDIVQNDLNKAHPQTVVAFVDLAGRSAQRLGFARSLGQIYAVLYLSPRPMTLQDLMDSLGISKGGASMSVRQLAAWGAVRQVWVRGDRRDHYEANADFGAVMRETLFGILKPRLKSSGNQLKDIRATVEAGGHDLPPDEAKFVAERLARLEALHKKLSKVLPFAEALLK